MAELLIKIGDGANYTDGDVLCAFSDRHIACVHAQMICHKDRSQRNGSGWIVRGELSETLLAETMQYRFERISATEVRRVEQATNQSEIFGPSHIDVRQYLVRRRKHAKNLIFGEDGSEVWYGGRTDYTMPTVRKVWNKIERDTPNRLRDEKHSLWSMGRMDIRHHLAIRTVAITEKDVADFTEPQYEVDDNGNFVWDLNDGDQVTESGTTTAIDSPPDDRPGWQIAVASKRRQKIAIADILGDIAEAESDVRDAAKAIGQEINENGAMRYTSKVQPSQAKARINKKPPAQMARP